MSDFYPDYNETNPLGNYAPQIPPDVTEKIVVGNGHVEPTESDEPLSGQWPSEPTPSLPTAAFPGDQERNSEPSEPDTPPVAPIPHTPTEDLAAPLAAIDSELLPAAGSDDPAPAVPLQPATEPTIANAEPPESTAAVAPGAADTFADATNEHAETPAPEYDPRERVALHFIEGELTPENAGNIASAIAAAGCTTVAFELVGGTLENRAMFEDILQSRIDHAGDPTALAHIDEFLGEFSEPYITKIMEQLPTTVERVRIFDVAQDQLSHVAVEEFQEQDARYRESIRLNLPNNAIRHFAEQSIRASVDAVIERTALRAEQLTELAVAEAPLEPHTIGVVSTYVHEATREQMDADGFNCSNATVVANVLRGDFGSSPPDLLREYVKDPARPLDPVALDRQIVGDHYYQHGYGAKVALDMRAALTEGQLDSLMINLDEVKENGIVAGKTDEEIKAEVNETLETMLVEVLRGRRD